MIVIGFEINSELVTKRAFGQIMEQVNRQWMVDHATHRLPKHFEGTPETQPGGGGYRYRRRTAEYTEKKRKKFGHGKPLVYTGKLRDAVLAKVKITATQHGARLITRGTSEHRLQTWMKQEIEVVSRREQVEAAKVTQRRFAALAKDPKYRRRRQRKVKA